MDEQGFDFTPGERREPKPFEPPPWERDAFEELQRKKPSDAGEDAGTRADVSGLEPAVSEAAGQGDATPLGTERPIQEPSRGTADKVGIDEAQVLEMLSELSAEEPARPNEYFAIGVGAGLVLLAIGGVLIIWAMAALVSSRQTGSVGQWSGVGLGMFGAFFMGMGVWMLYRTLKQRGVL